MDPLRQALGLLSCESGNVVILLSLASDPKAFLTRTGLFGSG